MNLMPKQTAPVARADSATSVAVATQSWSGDMLPFLFRLPFESEAAAQSWFGYIQPFEADAAQSVAWLRYFPVEGDG